MCALRELLVDIDRIEMYALLFIIMIIIIIEDSFIVIGIIITIFIIIIIYNSTLCPSKQKEKGKRLH